MAGRHRARRLAVDILFQADLTGRDALSVLAEWEAAGEAIPAFTKELVRGVTAERAGLDRLIGDHAEAWSVGRMAAVDRAILRLAAYELRSRPDVPTAVVIDEAVDAAKELSTAESGSFVNGILGAIAAEGESRAAPHAAAGPPSSTAPDDPSSG